MPRIEKYTEKRYSKEEGHKGHPEPGEMRITEIDGAPQHAIFRCPCGCGDINVLPLVSAERPRTGKGPVWDYHTSGHMIHPSVLHLAGCKSHYYIKLDGTVTWCP